ncbi:hypothetical protein BU25DRAFT_461842 [Macroventuria anomochaeta]|uniref:Uncharacterized protein n=1 Tax=Macroventuria anomochaeta TaxID=301207 RepID=A0ACB6RPX4_9PLEO|nr:uncharacterized protein BU25DRAFT_461842 [Macroventuria anomochaeta]KAF2623762.1 hypothetical protein BU25DRAFT_461842 [Macroventuria anomochaeta]
MSETTPQDRCAAASSHTATKYTSLRTTALSFINAQSHNPSLPSKMDFESLRQLTTPSYTHSFGPAYSVSRAPKLQGSFTIESFIEHLGGMIPNLESWDVEVKGCVVDEVGESVVVRAGYGIQVKGAEEKIENDVVWWLELEEGAKGGEAGEGEGGGGWKVRKSTEMVDAGAAGRIMEEVMRQTGGGRKDPAAVAE